MKQLKTRLKWKDIDCEFYKATTKEGVKQPCGCKNKKGEIRNLFLRFKYPVTNNKGE